MRYSVLGTVRKPLRDSVIGVMATGRLSFDPRSVSDSLGPRILGLKQVHAKKRFITLFTHHHVMSRKVFSVLLLIHFKVIDQSALSLPLNGCVACPFFFSIDNLSTQ